MRGKSFGSIWFLYYLPDFIYIDELKYQIYQQVQKGMNSKLLPIFNDSEELLGKPSLLSSQYDALYDFYTSLNGQYWDWSNGTGIQWNFSDTNANPCFDNWQGISCDYSATYCTITGLLLRKHNLTGTIPSSINGLSTLKFLDLPHNHIYGQLPDSIGELSQLAALDLGYNRLTGTLTSYIGNLSSLLLLSMTNNLLVNLPDEIYHLPKIQALNFFLNNLQGTISSAIGNLSICLQHLNLGQNQLVGTIPLAITNLTNLMTLTLAFNQLEGSLPNTLGQLSQLHDLVLSGNKFTNTIPLSLANMTQLRTLILSHTHLMGSLPAIFGEAFQVIEVFLVQECLFSGSIPESYHNFHYVNAFYVEYNQFYGTIDFLRGMTSLILNQLNHNFFTGNTSSYEQLQLVQMSYGAKNLFTGTLPINLAWTEMKDYQFNDNYLTGIISGNLFNRSDTLLYVVLDNNYLTGRLPEFTMILPRIAEVSIDDNFITGTIPESIAQLQGLTQLIVENNQMIGTLPVTLGNLQRLVVLRVGYNSFSGSIPLSIRNLTVLQEFLVQQNKFTGPIDIIFANSLQTRLNNIDLSGNQFTGTLPTSFFPGAVHLQSFTASSNCLHGSIPTDICDAQGLVSLALDGLSTASNCRSLFFPSIPSFNSFTIRNFFQGGIPICLFNLSQISLLHLSGNGFSGSLPNDLVLAPTLIDLSLSHNRLSGDIPITIQQKTTPAWYNLDLSYNKFQGDLSTNQPFNSHYPSNTSISFEVNRLSGMIPSQYLSIQNISILDGNLFTCNFQQADLPQADPHYQTYTCGSDNVNYVLYVWIIVITSLFLIMIIWLMTEDSKSRSKVITNYLPKLFMIPRKIYAMLMQQEHQWQKFLCSSSSLSSDDHAENISNQSIPSEKIHIYRLFVYFQEIRQFFLWIMLYCLVVLMPIYGLLTYFASSYHYEYAWTISAMLLHGETAGIILFLGFIGLIGLITIRFQIFMNRLQKLPDYHSKSLSSSSQILNSRKSILSNQWREIIFGYSLIVGMDLMIMIIIDLLYVYIVINYDYWIVTLTAMALAIFRLGSNHILLTYALPLTLPIVTFFSSGCCVSSSSPAVAQSSSASPLSSKSSHQYSWRDMVLLENLILLNNVFIPTLAILCVLPDCFYNVLFAPAAVTSTYSYIACNDYFPTIDFQHVCETVTETSEYSPPFLYSYQCSSKIVMNYVPVYLLMFLFGGILIPIIPWLIKWYYNVNEPIHSFKKSESTSLNYSLDISSPNLIPEMITTTTNLLHTSSLEKTSSETEMKLSEDDNHNDHDQHRFFEESPPKALLSLSNPAIVSTPSSPSLPPTVPLRFWQLCLPEIFQPIRKTSQQSYSSSILFSKIRFTVKINSALAIMISFGALFPPLACIAGLAVLISTYSEQQAIYQCLVTSRLLQANGYELQIEQESEGVEWSLILTIWSILCVACGLFAYIIFDTIGDTNGWFQALPLTIVMSIMPILFYGGITLYHYIFQKVILIDSTEKDSDERKETEKENESEPIVIHRINTTVDSMIANHNSRGSVIELSLFPEESRLSAVNK